ncbi:MAG: Wzz/FepE/Etk N-terminal domain-containing protein, partial [Phycisphaerae bacterium]
MTTLNPQTSTRDLLTVLFRRKWSMLAIFCVTTLGTLVWVTLIREDVYAASARVLVKAGQEQAMPPTVLNERNMMVVGQRYQDIRTEVEILSSEDLLSQVVDELGLDQPPPPAIVPEKLFPKVKFHTRRLVKSIKEWKNELLIRAGFRIRPTPRQKALHMLEEGIIVDPIPDSNVIMVRMVLPARQYVGPILEELLERYLRFRLTVFVDQRLVDFFESQVTTATEHLSR